MYTKACLCRRKHQIPAGVSLQYTWPEHLKTVNMNKNKRSLKNTHKQDASQWSPEWDSGIEEGQYVKPKEI